MSDKRGGIHTTNAYSSGPLYWRFASTLFLLMPFLASCGGGHSQPPATIAGSWHFVMTSTTLAGQSTLADLFFTQNGSVIQSSGSQVVIGGVCSVLGTMTGAVTGNKVTMSIIHADMIDRVSATATVSGNSLSGTYSTAGQCLNGDAGTITGQMIPVLTSSAWAGTRTPTNQQTTFPLSANIAEDNQGLLVATFSFTGGLCSGTFTFNPSLVGNLITNINGNPLSVEFVYGTVDPTGKQISGGYSVLCNGGIGGPVEGGIYTLSRP
jgi:hypothetical protein